MITCPIHQIAVKYPSRPAIIDEHQTVTYRELNERINVFKNLLHDPGVKPSARAGIFAERSVATIAILFALWRTKAIACVLNTQNPVQTIKTQLEEINAKFLITDNTEILNSKILPIPKINLKNFPSTTYHLPLTTYHYSKTHPATIIFTSGSTGNPKAALHSFGNHYVNALGSNENIHISSSTRWLLSLPLYHVSGIGILFRTFLGGGTVVLPDRNKPLALMINHFQITHLSCVTTQLIQLMDSRIKYPTLKHILIGGSPIPEKLIKKAIRKKLPVHISYGLTEMASQVATSACLLTSKPQAGILKYRQVRISKKGEVLVKGPTLFQGYVTEKKIKKPFDAEGWFPTGDLGQMTQHRYLTILGRKDNLFISGGENIQPEEIEKYLKQIPGIEEAVVVPVKHKLFGFVPAAYIQWASSPKLPAQRITQILSQTLPKYKIPTQYLSWPKNVDVGLKIDRQKLKILTAV